MAKESLQQIIYCGIEAPSAEQSNAVPSEIAQVSTPATTDGAVTATQEAEPKKRRGSRRAASSSGAPVALQPVDLSAAPAVTTSLTKVAGDVSEASRDVAPKAPARKKRARVSAPAGAPTSVQTKDAAGE